jgi:hypothetical protein
VCTGTVQVACGSAGVPVVHAVRRVRWHGRSNEMVTLHLGSGYALQVFFFDERGGHHARSDTNRD